jgi:hypothetical protein
MSKICKFVNGSRSVFLRTDPRAQILAKISYILNADKKWAVPIITVLPVALVSSEKIRSCFTASQCPPPSKFKKSKVKLNILAACYVISYLSVIKIK